MPQSALPWIYAALGLTLLCAAVEAAPREVRAAKNAVDESVPRGERPYEMVWAHRQEAHPPTEGFEDLTGWTVELYGAAQATFERSRQQVIWGETSGKLTYRGGAGENRILLRPPRPIAIPGRFNACDFWVWGNNWGWIARPDTPQVGLAVYLTDAKGQEHRVAVTNVRWEEWWLAHARVINQLGPDPAFPFSLTGIEVTGGSQPEDRVIYLDSLACYEEELPALKFEPRPARNLQLFPGQGQGLNGTGPGRLPFPTREETILPTNLTRDFKTSARQAGERNYELTYQGSDGELTYRLQLQDAGFAKVEALLNGQRVAAPLEGGGVRAEQDAAAKTLFVRAALENGVVTVVQEEPPGGVELSIETRYRLWQKSLVVDVLCRGGHATELSLGEFAGVEKPELLPIPYANYGGTSVILLSRGPGRPWFGSVWVDWYRSNASEMYAAQGLGPDRARVNGGVRYLPKTDGHRNDLFERLFVTVSPIYEETLPTIANPPSRWGKVAGERLWQESWGPDDYQKQHERSVKLRAYGIEKLIQCNHEIAWRDDAASFTLRLKAAPKKGGDEALQRYVAAQKSLGWRSGLYTNYTDFAPVNENWSPDNVQLSSDGEWRAAWPRCYGLKPSRAVELDAYYAPRVKAKYGPDSDYTDVHTAVAPWGYCDYDARVPGAGTFAATFYAYGEILLNDSRVYQGPIFSEGSYQSLYAGLPDGNYALQYGGLDLAQYPLLPQFDLYKMHPLSTDIGMGWTGNFCTWSGWARPENLSASIDRFLMATMTYGHIGWLVEEAHGLNLACRSYYMLQQLTPRYTLTPPTALHYWTGAKWETTSEALVSGAYKRSQLKIEYPNVTLYVNGNWTEDWRIERFGHLLPPAGWFAYGDGGRFFELSALRDGRRFDWVQSPEYLYADGRGELTFLEHVTARGGVAIRALDADTLEIIDIGGNREVGFGGLMQGQQPVGGDVIARVVEASRRPGAKATAYDVTGRELGAAEIRHVGERGSGKWYVMTVPEAVRYVVRLDPRPETHADAKRPRLPLRNAPDLHVEPWIPGTDVAPGQKAGLLIEGLPEGKGAPRATVEGQPGALAPWAAEEHNRNYLLTLPPDVKPGQGLWVKIEVGEGPDTQVAWQLLAVRDPVRLSFQPETITLLDGEGTAHLRGFLGAPEARLEAPPWLTLSPSRISSDLSGDHEVRFRAERVEPGTLRIVALVGGGSGLPVSEAAKEFDLIPGTAQPVIANLYDGSLPFEWGLAVRHKPEQPGDPQTGAVFQREGAIPCGGVAHDGLFAAPPWIGGVGYSYALFAPVKLPDRPCELHLFIGLKDGGDPSDGVDFIVKALCEDGSEVEILKANTAERKWTELTADLSKLAGRKVRFKLIDDVGPHDNSIADWASWGEPTVRLKSPAPTLTIRPRP